MNRESFLTEEWTTPSIEEVGVSAEASAYTGIWEDLA